MTAASLLQLLTSCTTASGSVPASMEAGVTRPGPTGPDREAKEEAPLPRTDEEWRSVLTPAQFYVLREKGTEPPFLGKYWNAHDDALYVCSGCANPLFDSDAKFSSGTGWPSFYQPYTDASVETRVDESHGMRRIEVVCRRCGGHLGHLFPDGPAPTGLRYCINSVAVDQRKR